MNLEGKHVFLTGGSGAIGLELALGLLNAGASVTIGDMADPDGEWKRRALAHFEKCDLEKADDIKRALGAAVEKFGPIDILIHAAAHQPMLLFEDLEFPAWRRTFAVNVDSFFHLVKGVLPFMKEKGWGRIVSFTSGTFDEGAPAHINYVASKAALIGATRVLAKEVGQYGITVNTLSPGLTKTATSSYHVEEMMKLGHPNYFDLHIAQQSLKRSLTPKDHVGPTLFLVSDMSAAISGQNLHVDGGKNY
ncbi:SDR family NAD(P)-dependent oxidoreductase [Nocardia fusca]|uniref:SDR family NAD(P)-dependent oxidoreductase n=1 Tax=Nocardia fusca TaxID=941183 RepID=UPI0037CBC4F7